MIQYYYLKICSDAIDFEYIFHTHPSTPNPGSRDFSEGILYEFPSV